MRLPVTPTGHSSRPPSWTCFSPAHACASRDCPMLCLLQPMMLAGRPRHAWRSPRAPGGRLQRKMSRKGELRKAKRRHTWATPISLTRRAYYYVSCGFQRGGRQHGSPSSPLSAPSRLRLRAAQASMHTPATICSRVRPAFPAPSRPGRRHGWQRSPLRARVHCMPRARQRSVTSRPGALSAARHAPPAPRTAACRRRPRRRARRRRPARPRCRGRSPWAPPRTPAGRRGAAARYRRALRARVLRSRTRSSTPSGVC